MANIPKATRKRILRRDKICSYCLTNPSTTLDHIIPKSKGGTNRHTNLAGCCSPCNGAKGSLTIEEFGIPLTPSDRLIYACEAEGFSAYDYNDPNFVPRRPIYNTNPRPMPPRREKHFKKVARQTKYVYAEDIPNYYDQSLGERLSSLGMKGLKLNDDSI